MYNNKYLSLKSPITLLLYMVIKGCTMHSSPYLTAPHTLFSPCSRVSSWFRWWFISLSLVLGFMVCIYSKSMHMSYKIYTYITICLWQKTVFKGLYLFIRGRVFTLQQSPLQNEKIRFGQISSPWRDL